MILRRGGFTHSLIKTDLLTICLVYSIGESKQDPANKTKRLRLVNSQLSPGLEIRYLNVSKGGGSDSEPNTQTLIFNTQLPRKKPLEPARTMPAFCFNPWHDHIHFIQSLPSASLCFFTFSQRKFSCSSGKIIPVGKNRKEPS